MDNIPTHSDHVFGHEHAIAAFNQARDSSRFPHGWLIAGPKGVGKHTLALYFAKQLLNCEEGEALQRFNSGTHQGLYEVKRLPSANGRLSSFIRTYQIQEMQRYLHQTIDNHAWRVVIIDDADRMNTEAANHLLKILEEPPERVVFFLLSTTENMLPTIRSRTRLLRLLPLKMSELRRALPDLSDSVLSQVYGCPGLAYRLQDKETQISVELVKYVLSGKTDELDQRIEALCKGYDNTSVVLFLELLERAIADRATKLGKNGDLEGARKASMQFSAITKLEKSYASLNLDKEAVVRTVIHEAQA